MKKLDRPSLASARKQIVRAKDQRELVSLLALLEADDRAGAQTLAKSCRRKIDLYERRQRRERELFVLRNNLFLQGYSRIAGVDEVGMGPLAGPVVAAAVILGETVDLPGLDDSKRVSRQNRERLAVMIRQQAMCYAIGSVGPEEIDRINIYRAGLEAMKRAVTQLMPVPDHVLVDGRSIPELMMPQTSLVHGDRRDGSIAAASILAKVFRDSVMVRMDKCYPGYGFASHMGYPTPQHLKALRSIGPSKIHRRSFSPVRVSANGG